MRQVSVRNWFHHMHMPGGHNIALHTSHIMHSERFWAIFALVVLMSLVVGLAIWASLTGGPVEEPFPIYPYYPYL